MTSSDDPSRSAPDVEAPVGRWLPWVSFNSDEASLAPEGVFLESNAHPRAYGSFARVLAKYVRDEQVLRNGEHTGATPGRVVRGPGWVMD